MTGPRLVILGKQGAGKGTQAERLARHFSIPRISTGDMFRRAIQAGTEAGVEAERYMDSGELVPDDIVIGIVEDRLSEPDAAHGFVLDGFPRTAEQAKALDDVLTRPAVDLVLELQVPTDIVLGRLAERRVCDNCGLPYSPANRPKDDWICDVCGGKVIQRDDDTEAAIKRRLDLYTQRTEPLVAYYMAQDKLATIDGTGDSNKVTSRILRGIEKRLGRT
ncbi:MAG: adenylate kinase [Actinobacteria bacterium]|nr:adenylate kinase [Actinomycetota bacterium]